MEKLEEFLYKALMRLSTMSDATLVTLVLMFCALMFLLTTWILFY